jgi:hypothetical protein
LDKLLIIGSTGLVGSKLAMMASKHILAYNTKKRATLVRSKLVLTGHGGQSFHIEPDKKDSA